MMQTEHQRRKKNCKDLTFTYNVEIYDKQGDLVKTGLLTWSLGIPELDVPKLDIIKIDRTAVTPWIED